MKFLVYGSNGWIGQQFLNLLDAEGLEYVRGHDRCDRSKDEIKRVNPTHVVSFIGRTHGEIDGNVIPTIDYLEQPGKLVENVNDNFYSPLYMAIECTKLGIHFTQMGTGCIFSYDELHPYGDESTPFTEESDPNFFGSQYSVVKGFTDRMFKDNFEDSVLNIRIRMPITSERCSRNFITKITSYKKICSIPNSMTVLPTMLPVMLNLITESKTGTFNLCNPGLISHNKILQLYRDIVDPNFKWCNFSVDEQNSILASKRSNNFLSTNKISEFDTSVPDITTAVIECLKNYPKPGIRVLVTGGCGFIGSNFINHIFDLREDWDITNIDRLNYAGNRNNVDEKVRTSNRYRLVEGCIRDQTLVSRTLDDNAITHVIHFAAQTHVQNSYKDGNDFILDNIDGTLSLLECIREYGKIKKMVHVSTDEVYGQSLVDKKTEASIMCPTNPYAATKAGAEMIVTSFMHSYGLPIIITRGNNVYGKNQNKEKLIPRFIDQFLAGNKLTIQGDGMARRAFMHSTDAASAFLTVLENGNIGEIYNLGGADSDERTVLEVAKELLVILKGTEDINLSESITHVEDRPFNDMRYLITDTKLRDLGWTPKVNFKQGIQMLVDETRSKST